MYPFSFHHTCRTGLISHFQSIEANLCTSKVNFQKALIFWQYMSPVCILSYIVSQICCSWLCLPILYKIVNSTNDWLIYTAFSLIPLARSLPSTFQYTHQRLLNWSVSSQDKTTDITMSLINNCKSWNVIHYTGKHQYDNHYHTELFTWQYSIQNMNRTTRF